MTWIVVKFDDTDEVEAVPLKWFNSDASIIMYPNFKAASEVIRAIKHQQTPTDDWLRFKVLYFCD